MFPRFFNDFGATREMGISFSCPVAADIMFNLSEPMSFCDEQNDLPPELNDIDAQTYYYLVKARKNIFSVLYDRTVPINKRIIKLLDYAVELQNNLDDYPKPTDDIDFFDVFRNPELINPQWADRVDNGKYKSVANEVFNENIASYFIFRYFLKAAEDYDALSKIKMAAVGVLITTCFGEDSRTVQLWSKETEHSQYNMDRYKKLLRTAECLSADNLKKLLSM